MKLLVKVLLILATGILPASAVQAQWMYDDAENWVNVSGAVCRGQDGTAEWDLYHYPGSTSVGTWVSTPVRVYCPVNRRNLHAYAKNLSHLGFNVEAHNVWVKVDSPSGTLQCRLFGVDLSTGVALYTPWETSPIGTDVYVAFSPYTTWETVNWGVMCDVPGGEAIRNIEIRVANDNL